MQKTWKGLIGAVYGLGVLIVAGLLAAIVFRADAVPFPGAMLPMKLSELASIWLALGFLPMLVASWLFHTAYEIPCHNHKRRDTLLVFAPSLVCLLCGAFWVGVLIVGILNMPNF